MRHALFSAVALAAFSATQSVASPVEYDTTSGNGGVTDATILNYALTLEHLENAFYSGALAKFNQKDFLDAGLPAFARGRFSQIAEHEKTHVAFLSGALGSQAVQPCTYKFPYTDPKSFAALSQVLEGVGVSAYTGAAQFISNKDYLTAAASILSTEARHASWVASAVNKVAGWSGSFDVPLGLNQVFTLAAQFITSCPSSNPVLPVKAFPSLALTGVAPGKLATINSKGTSTPTFIVFFTGLDKIFVPISNGQVKIPDGLSGQVYAIATSSGTEVTDATTVAGPAILLFERDSNNNLISSS